MENEDSYKLAPVPYTIDTKRTKHPPGHGPGLPSGSGPCRCFCPGLVNSARKQLPYFHDGKMVTARPSNPVPDTPGVCTEAATEHVAASPWRAPGHLNLSIKWSKKQRGKGCALRVC